MTPALCPWSWLQGVRHALIPRDHLNKWKVESSEHRATVILNSIYRVKGLYKITALREISKWCLETKQSIKRLRCITVYWGVSMYRVSCSPIRSKHRWQESIEFNNRCLTWCSNFILSLLIMTPSNPNLNPLLSPVLSSHFKSYLLSILTGDVSWFGLNSAWIPSELSSDLDMN